MKDTGKLLLPCQGQLNCNNFLCGNSGYEFSAEHGGYTVQTVVMCGILHYQY